MSILDSIIYSLKKNMVLVLITICVVIIFVIIATALIYILLNFILAPAFGSQHIGFIKILFLAVAILAMLAILLKENL